MAEPSSEGYTIIPKWSQHFMVGENIQFCECFKFVAGGKSKYYIELSLHARTETAEQSFIGKTKIFIESVDKCCTSFRGYMIKYRYFMEQILKII